jgi:hypothetical protein
MSSARKPKAGSDPKEEMKIYLEHGAVTEEIKKLGQNGRVELVHFPYDSDSHIPKIADIAAPSKARISELNLPIKDLPGSLADYSGSVHLKKIFSILNNGRREDALHVDSAFKHGCSAFVTKDSDILGHRQELQSLLGIKFFHPNEWSDLRQFISGP